MEGGAHPVEEQYEPAKPKPILKLSKDVINKIAAAEIIHRPSNAIKELLENSLDAGSTSIKISLKEGGLKLIQITDNGHGINKSDLPLLCTRYATSKISEFKDLASLGTYGFRGEALASISYVSHVEVVTKTRDEGCGWKAHYSNGELVAPKPGAGVEPRPAAANDGTVISAEDLFYNMPMRKRAFKSPSEEYNRVLDVITKYAIHNPHVAWVCKKAGGSLPDISTPAASSTKANTALLYTPSLASELVEIPEIVLEPAVKLGAKCRGWVSSPNASWARKGGWLLFINNRLVDSSKIKRAIDSMYTNFLPKGASPWVYLSIDIDPSKVDVNVHPTKSEVHFLNEDEMVEALVAAVHGCLSNANVSRTFSVQTLLPGAPEPSDKRSAEASSGNVRKPAPNYKVRMDPSNRTLDSMITVANPSQVGFYADDEEIEEEDRPGPSKRKRKAIGTAGSMREAPITLDETSHEDGVVENGVAEGEDDEDEDAPPLPTGSMWAAHAFGDAKGKGKASEIDQSVCEFTSIQELRKAARKRGNLDMTEAMQKHTFVGVVDPKLCLSLIQSSTKLFLINHAALGDEHFYQLGLRQFGAFNRLKLDPPPSLRELLRVAAEDEPLKTHGLTVDEVVESIHGLLLSKKDMLDEYFSLRIGESGELETLPILLRGYTPNLDRLPHFLLCLGTQVDWTSEKECFDTFLQELAFWYSPRPFADTASPTGASEEGKTGETEEEANYQAWQLQHVLFPSFRRYTAWPKDPGGTFQQIANLPDLFRIFERC